MNKIISFSVWGNNKRYLNGSIENIALAKEIYPGWVCRFYCDSEVDSSFISKIKDLGSQVVIMKTANSNWEGLFWRFLPASEDDVDVFISRDIDSRLNEREQAAVAEWLESDKLIHCMRDHIEHNVPILGGMWGCRKGALKKLRSKIDEWGKYDYKGSDQDFLRLNVWEPHKEHILAHDKYYDGFTIEQVVIDIEEYHRHRSEQDDYRQKTIVAKAQYIYDCNNNGLEIKKSDLDKLFPDVPEVGPVKTNDKGQIIIDYVHDPVKFFGKHDVRPFPSHGKMSYGIHVGEIIE